MTSSANVTSGILPEESQAGQDTVMKLVFLGVLGSTMATLLSGTFWTWKKGHKEKKTAGVTVVPQQSLHRRPQHYLLMFYTGSGRHSATTANVFCQVYGNVLKTKPIVLRDPDRPLFQPSSVSSFLVTLSRSLDKIREIHIWHDISGPDPPWYLESVIICHLNTDVTWYFEANRWLDVSTGSKEVECKLQPLQRRSFLRSTILFKAKINDNLKNKHLWLSPFLPHSRKTFNKFQKLSCCLALAAMMAFIATILVETTQTVFSDATVSLGPWNLKLGDIYRGIVCSAVVFVVRLLLESLFLNSERKRTLDTKERNVEEYIRDVLQKLNSITFVGESAVIDGAECSLNSQDESLTSNDSINDKEVEFTSSKEVQIENKCANNPKEYSSQTEDKRNNVDVEFFSESLAVKSEEKNCSSKEVQNLGDLFEVLGNLPEKGELMQILGNENNKFASKSYSQKQKEDIGTTHNEDPLLLDHSFRQESVAWTATVTSPDEISELWKQLPFSRHLIDKCGIKKLRGGTPKLPQIVFNITQVQCLTIPLLSTVIVLIIGIQWPAAMITSWIMTFVIALVFEIFGFEMFYVLVHSLYFATWCKRPVKEEDLINELVLDKVWINDEQKITYYTDEVIGGEEGDEVPRPPTEEDIQNAQETAGRERELEDVLKMLAFNVLFLVLLILISFGNRDPSSYPTRNGIESSFNISKSFNKVKNIETFWKWLMNDTIPVLLFDPFDKSSNEGRRHFLTDGYTYVLGTAIVRQQRIKSGMSCQITDVAKNTFADCHPVTLTSSNEDKSYYHEGWKKNRVSKESNVYELPWKYVDGKESKTDYTSWGRTNAFHGGGYIAYLTSERQTTLKLLQSLKEHHWVDQLTRVVFLEFSIYNANVNIISAMIFSVEFTSYGGALPRFDMYSFRLYRYYTPLQFMYLVCEVVFVVFVVQLISRVGHQIFRDRWSYFMSFWNYSDLLLIFFSIATIALYAVRWFHLSKAIEEIRENPNRFYGFLTVSLYDEFIAYMSCLIFIIPCLQFTKFLKFNKNFMIFYATLERIRQDVCGFVFVFLVSMLCFTFWAYTMLKTVAEVFSTFGGTFYSMIAMLLGKFSFRLLAPGQSFTTSQIGPLFTYVFTCTNVFFILNIILTIITIGFTEAQKDERHQKSEYEIMNFISNYVKDRLGLLPPYIPPPPQILPPSKEKHDTYFQWKLCTSYVIHSQFRRIIKFTNDNYLEDFKDELEMVADLLGIPMPKKILEEIICREQTSDSFSEV